MAERPLTRDEVRSVDRRAIEELGMSSLVLMENAGRSAAEWLVSRAEGGPVLILCGPGNNGGDGGVLARHLDLESIPVKLIWFADPQKLSADASAQHTILARSGFDQEDWPGAIDRTRLDAELAKAVWVVDALLGTGLTRPVEGPLREVIEAVNASGSRVLALDLPSGLDADTGLPQGVAIRAISTVTFVASKVGFHQPGARDYTGEVDIAGIGVPRSLLVAFGLGDEEGPWTPSPP
ncbi:MAG TPA: NAD(P)H-hydrate epimerase [Isosphaeraceae bacterium]|nr:NAD(P)H-hydrate epimerase [Isosphaeraceae bacterium]